MTENELRRRFPGRPDAFYRRNATSSTNPATVGKMLSTLVANSSPPLERKSPRNRKNDGRPWQNELLACARAYADLGVLKMEKVDAPNKFVRGKIIPVDNPFPDFVGVWCKNRRMIAVEAKSTSDHLLGINVKGGGLTVRQVNLLRSWHEAGAISGVLWNWGGGCAKWVPFPVVEEELRRKARSLHFEHGTGVLLSPGRGFVTWDFAKVWEALGY